MDQSLSETELAHLRERVIRAADHARDLNDYITASFYWIIAAACNGLLDLEQRERP